MCVVYNFEKKCYYGQRKKSGPGSSSLDSGSKGPGSGSARAYWVVFLSETLCSHSAFLHPRVYLSLVLIYRRPNWDNCGICEHLSLTHNLSQALTTGLSAKLS